MMNDTDLLTVGATLKSRRKQLGLSLEDIAEKTCVRFAFLKAIEEDRFDGFPGDAYLQGFLKAFAETLGLDVQSIVEQFRQQTGIRVGDTRETMPEAYDLPIRVSPRKRKSYRRLLSLAVLGGLIGGSAYFTMHYWPFSAGSAALESERSSSPAASATIIVEPIVDSSPGDLSGPLEVSTPTIEDVPSEVSRNSSVAAELPISEPTIYPLPEAGGLLRVEAVGSVTVTLRIDDLPARGYTLTKDTVLSWRVSKALELHVNAPDMIKVWLDNDLLEWRGRSELILRFVPPAVSEEER